MARHNVVRKIKNRTTIILVMLLISIMVSWVIWGNLSVDLKTCLKRLTNFLLPIFRICIMQNTEKIMKS